YMRKDGRAAASAMYEGKRITKYGKTKKEAWENLQAVLDDLKQGKAVIGPKQTVKQYLEHWLENERRLRIRASTLIKYREILHGYLIPAFGHLQLSQLSSEQVQALYALLIDKGLAAKTIKHVHTVLYGALKDAVKHGLLAKNVCTYVTLPRGKKFEAHPLSQDECLRLIAAAHGHRLWFLILLAITTGARRGELLALRWSDVNPTKKLIYIHRTVARLTGMGFVENEPKTVSSIRNVQLSQVVLDSFEEQRQYIASVRLAAGSSWVENDLVFPNRDGSYLDHWVIAQQFTRVLQKAGLPHIRFHDLRHSAATLLLASGVNVKVVQEMLGHSDIHITLGMYAHVLPTMQQEAVQKIENMFGGEKR
ncbi:MAG: tyrosine-type recombinase/integrase, partial [Ktedonobacteraceae bacterium]